ncbi:MAG: hypothetical protein AB7V77_04775 [Candidatus Woesearchaeota archaeon]
MNKLILLLKYFKNTEFIGKHYLEKMFKHARKYDNMFCYHRATYLYWKLKKEGLNPKILKYYLQNNNPEAPFSKQFKHISNKSYGFHFVVELDGTILDPNTHLCKKIKFEDYNKYCIEFYPIEDIVIETFSPMMSEEESNTFFQYY